MAADHHSETHWKRKLTRELTTYGLNVLYLYFFLGMFTLYRRLILAEYQIDYLRYGVSLITALILAKIIMIGDIIGLGRRLEDKPLIYPTLYKTVVFTLWVFLFSIVEHLGEGWLRGQGLTGGLADLASQSTYGLLAKSLIVFLAFLPFFAFRELDRILGGGRMLKLFFSHRRRAMESDE